MIHQPIIRRIRRGIGAGVPTAVSLAAIDAGFWTQGPAPAYDELTVVGGAVTITDPDDGAIGLTDRAAAHGVCYHDFGAAFADHIRVGFWWSGARPAEASPVLHIDLGEPEGGMGCYPISDLLGDPGNQPAWALATMGDTNANFAMADRGAVRGWTAEETARWGNGGRAHMQIVSSAGELLVFIDGHYVIGADVPAALVGSTVHGFTVDNNQVLVTPGDVSAPFPRTPDWPGGYGPFTIERI